MGVADEFSGERDAGESVEGVETLKDTRTGRST